MKSTLVFAGLVLGWTAALGAQSVPRPTATGPAPAAVSSTEALFDLGSPGSSPFPSDWFTVTDPTNLTHRRVSLPMPPDYCQTHVSDCYDRVVLNELDGFNIQPRLSVPFSGPIDPSTVTSNTVFLVSLGKIGPGEDTMPWGTKIGIDQVVWDPTTQTLHVESNDLLAQHTRFALIVTRGVLDEDGVTPVEASEAFRQFRATIREDYKEALLEAIHAARQAGVSEENIAVASVFTTESATAVLEKIRDQIHAATPDPADFLLGPSSTRTVFNLNEVTGIVWNIQTQANSTELTPGPAIDLSLARTPYADSVGTVAFGKYFSPDYEVHPGEYIPAVGTRSGTPAVRATNEIYFDLFLPSGTKPSNGWPVEIFVHGINGSKDVSPLHVASSMAHYGIATIAINDVGHGYGAQSTLTVSRSEGDPVTFYAGGRGRDQGGDNTIGSNEGLAAAPPRTISFFSDGYRQTAVDLMQLVRVIEVGMDVDGDGQRDLDASRIYLFSQSLGAGIGTVFVGVEPDVRLGVFAVPFDPIPGGPLSCSFRNLAGAQLRFRMPSLLNNPPGIRIQVLDGCPVGPPLFNENFPLKDQVPLTVQLVDETTMVIQSPVTNTIDGAMAIQEAAENLKWAGQAGSPLAYAPHLRKAPLAGVPAKSVLFLIAKGDQTAPNPTTTAIVRAGDLADRTLYYLHDLYRAQNPSLPANPHGFAVGFPVFGEITLGVQDMVGKFFFSDGTVLTAPEPSQYFEFPIVLPLPDSLNYLFP